MTARADVEQIQSTRTEKLLAVVLAAFLVLGGVWTYTRLDNVVRSHEPLPRTAFGQGPAERTFDEASFRLSHVRASENAALRQLVLKREAYRTALEAHRPAAKLSAAYDAAQARYGASQHAVSAAGKAVSSARPAAAKERKGAGAKLGAALQRDALVPARRLGRRGGDDPRVRPCERLRHGLLRPVRLGARLHRAPRHRQHAARLLGAAAVHRPTPAAAPCAPRPVPVLRLPGRGGTALRRLPPRCRRGVRAL